MARISVGKFHVTGSTTGVLTSVAAGTFTPGATVANSQVRPGTLTAQFVVDAETDTLTIEAAWQVSQDGSTWVDLAYTPNNAAAVVLATGTAGADASVTKVVPAPQGASGWRFVRAGVVNKVAEGTVNDTYAISYGYIRS